MNIRRYFIIFPLIIGLLLTVYPLCGFAGSRLSSYEERLLTHINQFRKANGLNPLVMDEKLTRLAERHCTYMEGKNVLSHERFNERFRQSERSLCVENVGWNYQTPEDQFRAWKTSREHNKNLLNKEITHTGIARTGTYVTFFACTGEE
jgi:uncharacterized protein YkwD